MPYKPPKISAKRSVSQVSGSPCAMSLEGFLRKCVELAGDCISLDGCVESISVKHLEPGAKTRQLPGGQLLDGFFDVFSGCHFSNLAL